MAKKELNSILANLPEKPGVYLMKNAQGEIIYVGKATSLRNRVRQYFQSSKNQHPKVRAMTDKIEDIDYVVAGSELEALMLECNLIKAHTPHYNILLKDDKHYPYVRIDLKEAYPKLCMVRRTGKDGAKYYGPYIGMGSLKELIDMLSKILFLRTCSKDLNHVPLKTRPCLNAQMGACCAPCQGKISEKAYKNNLALAQRFLSGQYNDIQKMLQGDMEKASEALQYEKAAKLRDLLHHMQRLTEKQKVILPGEKDKDVLGIAELAGETQVALLPLRDGKMRGMQTFKMQNGETQPMALVLQDFILQYYEGTVMPREILIDEPLPEQEDIENLLGTRLGKKVEIIVPKRGEKRQLVDMAMANALQVLQKTVEKKAQEEQHVAQGLKDLAAVFNLPTLPMRIEGYDISNIQGVSSVGSMVVLKGGRPDPSAYRRFKIKTVEGANDFASMKEVLGRRFTHGEDERFGALPDLILIDGGKIQLAFAKEAAKELGYDHIPMFGLAKRFEEIYLPQKETPILLSKHSDALRLLQQLRDEAHRFAITYHRSLRSKKGLTSALQNIKGIGKQRQKALFTKFRSIEAISHATMEELLEAPGMTKMAAQAVYDYFRQGLAPL